MLIRPNERKDIMAKTEAINISNLFPPRYKDDDDSEAWSPNLPAAFACEGLIQLGLWVERSNGKLDQRKDFWGFLDLIRFIEAIIIYDRIVIVGDFWGEDQVLKKLRNEGIVADWLIELELIGKNYSGVDEYPMMKTARRIYPIAFEDNDKHQGSMFHDFINRIISISVSDELHLPLIPSKFDEVESILLRKKFHASRVFNAMDMVYDESKKEIFDGLQKILSAQGAGGVLISPVIYRWLKIINKKKIVKYDEMIDVALEIRNDLSKTRRYLHELSRILCDPSKTFISYNKAHEEILKLRKALTALASPEGERVFLFRLADLDRISPSLKGLINLDNPTGVLKELGEKQITWWSRRLRYRHVFHLFALFDSFLNSKNVATEMAKYLGDNVIERHIDWAKRRDYEIRNISQFRLLDDTEKPQLKFTHLE